MGNRWPSIKDLQNSQVGKSGKNAHLTRIDAQKPPQTMKGNISTNHGSKAKDWLLYNLQHWCNERALTLETEYQFKPDRKFRADFAIPALHAIIEYEGIYSETSRHTHVSGYNGDLIKYNAAAVAGWRVLRYSNANYKDVLRDLTEIHYNETIPF